MTRFLYIGLLSERYIRSTKGISRIEALRAYNPYSLWGGQKKRQAHLYMNHVIERFTLLVQKQEETGKHLLD